MKKLIIPLILCSVAGGSLYAILQSTVPASRSAQEKAAAMLKNIELVPSAAGGAAQAQPVKDDEPATKPTQIEAQRNHYLNAAIESLDGELNKLVCARAAYFQQKAFEQQQSIGASPEKWLLDQLQTQNSNLLSTTTQRGGFSGDADSQQAGRTLTIDTLAIVQALQQLYSNESKNCISEPYQAGEFVSAYLIRASQHRAAIEQLADQSQAEVAKSEQK